MKGVHEEVMAKNINRRPTRRVMVGNVAIGGGAPVSIQSMTNTRTSDIEATVAQIEALENAGCEIVRCAVPDIESAEALREIKRRIGIPLVADVHFDHRLALKAIENGADKIRINPGNIGSAEKVREVAREASARGIPMRVGVNGGSLEKALLEKYGHVCAEALVESAMGHISLLEDMDFHDIVISIKTSDVAMSYCAYSMLSEMTDHPLHIGVTEAGTVYRGTVRSAVGIGALLLSGIGDTLRVSLTGDPTLEIRAAKEILRACGMYDRGIEFISCPTCGRTQIDLIDIASRVEAALEGIETPLRVAVMGCAVNGPGEAREADVGIAGGKNSAVLFRKGRIVKKLSGEDIVEELVKAVKEMSGHGS